MPTIALQINSTSTPVWCNHKKAHGYNPVYDPRKSQLTTWSMCIHVHYITSIDLHVLTIIYNLKPFFNLIASVRNCTRWLDEIDCDGIAAIYFKVVFMDFQDFVFLPFLLRSLSQALRDFVACIIIPPSHVVIFPCQRRGSSRVLPKIRTPSQASAIWFLNPALL